ncbi:MAG: HD domain-containing protein, partial [Planctomycetota bacterium]|nr:HD domain-containing protein [Planctomycetota bacterium]
KDGAEMAAEYGLPRRIIDIIEQHHGRTLVTYFHHRARQQSAEAVSEQIFRYPGPLPQSREAAIVMLADSVEAATRSLEHPTPAHIRNLIHQIIGQRLSDDQLAQSELTFQDVRHIEEAFFRVLVRMHHSRIKYPSPDEAK